MASLIPAAAMTTPQALGVIGSAAQAAAPAVAQAAAAVQGARAVADATRALYRTIPRSMPRWNTPRRKRRRARETPSERMQAEPTATTRQRGQTVNDQAVALRTLTANSFPWPDQGAGVGQRLGATIRLAGVRCCEQFTNPNAYPIVVHWALLQPKRSALSAFTNNFFRATTGGERSVDFVDAQAGQQYEFLYNCYPINPDEWYILSRKKKILSGKSYQVDTQAGVQLTAQPFVQDTWHFVKYFRINKQFTFREASDTGPQVPIIRLFWWQPLNDIDWNPAADPFIQRQADCTMYFRPNVC